MFRDIWKRFGAKMLIVLCSVLLLGGVAIAAPRLRADDKIDLSTVQFVTSEPTTVTTGAAIWIPNPEQLVYNNTGRIVPKTIMMKKAGSNQAVTLTEGTGSGADYIISGTCSSVGKATVTMTAGRFSSELKDGTAKQIEYDILKAKITNTKFSLVNNNIPADYNITDNNILMVAGKNSNVSPSNIQIEVTATDGEGKSFTERLSGGTGYSLVQSDGSTPYKTILGGSPELYVQYSNYEDLRVVQTGGATRYPGLKICGDFKQLTVIVDPVPTNKVDSVTINNIMVYDGADQTNDNLVGKDQYSFGEYTTDDEKGHLRLNANNEQYIGYYENDYPFTPVSREALLLNCVGEKFNRAQDYKDDLNRNYKVHPDAFVNPENSDEISASQCTDFEYQFVSSMDYDQKGIPGATAGLLQIKFRITSGKYAGRPAHAYFSVIRDITDNNVQFQNEGREGITYKYGAHEAGQYTRVVKIHFSDLPQGEDDGEYRAIDTNAFNVSYRLEKWDDANNIIEEDEGIKDAGKVYITVKGQYDNKEQAIAQGGSLGGYYGTVIGRKGKAGLSFDIEKEKLTESEYFLELGTGIFAPSNSAPDVKTGTMLCKGENTSDYVGWLIDDELHERCEVSFYENKDGAQMTSWDGKTGTFWAKFTFSGNYTGDLWAEFQIEEFDLDYMYIELDPNCGCKETDGKHKYTGKEHQPAVKRVYYKPAGSTTEMDIPSTEYDQEGAIQYINAVNATSSNSKASVQITLNNGMVISKEFEIAPRGLDEGDLILDQDTDGFKGTSPNRTHEYMGQRNLPGITKLVLRTANGLSIPLAKDSDFTVDTSGMGVYDKTGVPVTVNNAKTNTDYVYRIAKVGSNFVNPAQGYAETEDFQITARSIKADDIDFVLAPKPYNSGDDEAKYKDYIEKNLVITDKKFSDVLDLNKHYEIEIIQLKVGENSTVAYRVKGLEAGFYTDQTDDDQLVLLVGRDITNAKVVEKKELDIVKGPVSEDGLPSGSAELVGPYSTAQGPAGGVTFIEAAGQVGVFLNYNITAATKKPLYNRSEYKVAYDTVPEQPKDPNDKNSPLQGTITLTGINGYYGTVEIKVPVAKKKLTDYQIVFTNENVVDGVDGDNIYDGSELHPVYKVVSKTNPDDVLVEGMDYEVPKDDGWHNNINASEGNGTSSEGLPYLKIIGINGYEGTITQTFTIWKRKIYKEDKDGHQVPNDDFTVEGWNPATRTYTYTPFTKTESEGEQRGVLPQVKLLYKGKELTRNQDYKRSYENFEDACLQKDHTYDEFPKVCFDADETNSRNFKGWCKETYEIRPVTLSDATQCTVTLEPSRTSFTGEEVHPKVSIKIVRDDKTEYDMEQADILADCEIKYRGEDSGNDIFISQDQESSSRSFVTVTGKKDGLKQNFTGNIPLEYIIYGQFQPNHLSGKTNSLTVVESGVADYNPAGSTGGCRVVFYEKLASLNGDNIPETYENAPKGQARIHELTEGGEYTVDMPNKIGIQDAFIRSNVNYLEGSVPCKITVRGNLDASYISYDFIKPVTYPVGGLDFHLENFLRVTYTGGNGEQIPLVYGTDYEFASTPTVNIGENHVTIQPAKKADENGNLVPVTWMRGSKDIEYNMTASMDGATINVEKEYPYAHGVPVLKPEDIKVTLDGVELNKNDYTIKIEGDATNVGTHKVIVTGNGTKFSGTIEQTFRIVPYHLEDAVKEGIITVVYPEEVEYTGSKVWPTVRSVRIAAHTLSDGKKEDESGAVADAEYETDAGSAEGKDYVNWTRDSNNRPEFVIRGKGNYTGEISYPYTIIRKDVGDEENVVLDREALKNLFYNNGKDIMPIPVFRYKGRDLTGIQYDSNNTDAYKDWQDYTIHFTYQHNGDLKRVGTKTITVRGIGNFTGERTVTYEVKPLNIGDTELVFTGETPVYNGQKQQPAFNLVFNGEVILQFNGTRVISDNITDVTVKFDNNENATKEGKLATVTVSIPQEAADNYYGTKEATFTIQPAPLAGHTRFLYHPGGENAVQDLSSYRLNLPFEGVGTSVIPQHPKTEEELLERTVGVYYQFPENRNVFLVAGTEFEEGNDYVINYQYVEPDTDDVEIRDGFGDAPTCSYAGKVKVTITGVGNYTDSASYWYFIGKDIASEATIRINPTTTVYNAQQQAPAITITGVDKEICTIGKYRGEVTVENLIEDKDFVNAGDYFIRVEGNPKKGTYSTQPQTLKYTITPRPISSSVVIDNYKKEYAYTGFEICPVGLSVTDYIEKIKYRLTEELDYTLSYANNVNAGTATITVNGQNNFSGTASAKFLITSSTITSGGSDTNSPFNPGTGEISGATAIKPDDVKLSMDTTTAMYYTGSQVYPKVSIAGMTENVDYTVTYSNNVEVGMATIYISGIGNNNGMITKNFDIIAQLSKCTVAPIPAQRYTGSAITPSITVTCGSNILVDGVDYVVSYANNVNIGTATVTIRSANNSNYVGSTKATFSISNDVGGFIISGYAPSYVYTGKAITPAIVVETGSATLTQGTDYTVTYADNVNAGMATITVTGIGKYSGTQSVNFIIEPKSLQSLSASGIEDKTYTGDAYTPSITISDGDKVLTNGVDYTVTYTNNTAPGLATAVITGTSSNYTGTKIVSFKIAGVAVKGLQASSVKDSSLKLSWVKQDYADGYQICDSKSKGIKSTTKNSISLTGLKGGTTYKYKVRSFIRNEDGTRSYGAFSSLVSATTKLKTPTVKIVSKKKGQAKLSWSKVSGATGYEIYYKKSSKAKYRKLKTINKANTRICTVKGMKSGDRAYFRVRAFKKSGSKKIYSALNPLKVITIK
ncbi:MAG: fibronectin type III domain-containing protein [Eubacterium sp.]|nr:fibronectin type III domain-containing protein [Eubacterium sp.]